MHVCEHVFCTILKEKEATNLRGSKGERTQPRLGEVNYVIKFHFV